MWKWEIGLSTTFLLLFVHNGILFRLYLCWKSMDGTVHGIFFFLSAWKIALFSWMKCANVDFVFHKRKSLSYDRYAVKTCDKSDKHQIAPKMQNTSQMTPNGYNATIKKSNNSFGRLKWVFFSISFCFEKWVSCFLKLDFAIFITKTFQKVKYCNHAPKFCCATKMQHENLNE